MEIDKILKEKTERFSAILLSIKSDWYMDLLRRTSKPGLTKCIRCKSDKTITKTAQTRAADEGMTEFG